MFILRPLIVCVCVWKVAGVISSIIVLITVLKIGPLFEDLPKVTLSFLSHFLLMIAIPPGSFRAGEVISMCDFIRFFVCSSGRLIHNRVCEFERNV